jgi:hypothetical protein
MRCPYFSKAKAHLVSHREWSDTACTAVADCLLIFEGQLPILKRAQTSGKQLKPTVSILFRLFLHKIRFECYGHTQPGRARVNVINSHLSFQLNSKQNVHPYNQTNP